MVDISAAMEVLSYDPESGVFAWKVNRGGLAKVGKRAGAIDSKGYVQIRVGRRLVLAHRLAWAFVHGAFPDGHLDHIDRNPANNAIRNLRLCTHAENHQNTGVRKDNTSGVTGVSFVKRSSKWLAYVTVNGKTHRIGLYESRDQAVQARIKAKAALHAFHPNQSLEAA